MLKLSDNESERLAAIGKLLDGCVGHEGGHAQWMYDILKRETSRPAKQREKAAKRPPPPSSTGLEALRLTQES